MIVVVLIIGVLAAILLPVFSHPYPVSPRTICRSNLKQIGLGFWQYTQDTNDRFPDVAGVGGWASAVQPYLKSWQIFHCPAVESKRAEETTDYFYNARLSRANREKIEDSAASILLAEGAGGQTPDYALSQLPAAWRTDETSPAHRHFKTANYLFVDGHVKSLKVAEITLDKPGENRPTFLVGWSR